MNLFVLVVVYELNKWQAITYMLVIVHICDKCIGYLVLSILVYVSLIFCTSTYPSDLLSYQLFSKKSLHILTQGTVISEWS